MEKGITEQNDAINKKENETLSGSIFAPILPTIFLHIASSISMFLSPLLPPNQDPTHTRTKHGISKATLTSFDLP